VKRTIAAIDVGTNTVLLTIAEISENSQIVPIFELSRLPRLGEGVDQARELGGAAVRRTLQVLEEYAQACRDFNVERLAVSGTSALRDAGRAGEFMGQAEAILGVPIEVESGEREAELTYKGAMEGLRVAAASTYFVFDVGGGSTEFIRGRGNGDVLEAISVDVGSVRLFERHGRRELRSHEELEAISQELRGRFSALPARLFVGADQLIGVAGTVASLFSIAHGAGDQAFNLAHAGRLSLGDVRQVCARLLGMSLEERVRIPCLGVGRADVILFGACIVLVVLERWAEEHRESNPSLVVSERGVRYGRLRELAYAL
jgi:exopolyphosphatase / guanosine-5'-triphosphate,3'-diphosphate pyrophosphatase